MRLLPMSTRLFALISVFILTGVCGAQAQSWIPLGPLDSDKASFAEVTNQGLATFQDKAYVIFSDKRDAGRVAVRQHTASGWVTLGNGMTLGASNYNDIEVDQSGNVYAAF